ATDVVVFEAAEIIDRATFDEPHICPLAFDAVIVNGRPVIDGDTHTEARPDHLLRRYGAELR
ncbi:MAG: D-aminoacylase, partial [Pseudomonadota bacterium]|nr:D-aminoacylase [Pseudomonadota bacterium]